MRRHQLGRSRAMWGLIVMILVAQTVTPFDATAKKKKRKPKPPPLTCPEEGRIIDRGDGWTSIAAPEFPRVLGPSHEAKDAIEDIPSLPSPLPSGDMKFPDPALSVFAVDSFDSKRIFVSNGYAVMRSLDGGCKWSLVFEVPTAAGSAAYRFSNENTTIRSIVIPANEQAHDKHVYVVLFEAHGIAGGLHVLRSEDGGDTWADWSDGLPTAGVSIPSSRARAQGTFPKFPRMLHIAPSDASTAYLALEGAVSRQAGSAQDGSQPQVDEELFVRRAGDSKWGAVIPLSDAADATVGGGGAREGDSPLDLVVDPIDPNEVWKVTLTGPPQYSHDGGESWDASPLTGGATDGATASRVGPLSIFHADGQPAEVIFGDDERAAEGDPLFNLSVDGGQSFSPFVTASPAHFYKKSAILRGSTIMSPLIYVATSMGDGPNGSQDEPSDFVLYRHDSRVNRWIPLGPNYDYCGDACDLSFAEIDWVKVSNPRPALMGMAPHSIEMYSGRM